MLSIFPGHYSDYYSDNTDSYSYRVDVQFNGRNQTDADDSYCINLDYKHYNECTRCVVYLNADNDFPSEYIPEVAQRFVNNVIECLKNVNKWFCA